MPITRDELIPLLQDPTISRIIHDYSDVDLGPDSLHRTLGPGAAQAKPGNDTIDFSDFTQYPFTPNAPTGILVTSNIITTNDGNKLAEVIVTWTPVTQNTDGTSVSSDELDSYVVSWRVASPVGDWTPEFEVDPTGDVAYFFGLKPGTTIDVRVAAINLAQNKSDYGYAFSVTVGADTTPPNQPSTPIVSSLFGAIRVQWDGKDSTGVIMALDFDHVDVHVSTTSTFIPDDSNKVDSIPTLNGGAVVLSYTDYGTNHYVKFTAVDKSGNHSVASAASAAVAARQGVDADFQNVSATKIIAGKLSVDVGLGGRILIGPLDANGNLISPLGARMELRNDGIHIFNGSNVEVATMAIISGVPQINISGPIVSGGSITGAIITGGTIQTATGGTRVVISATTQDRIQFYWSGSLAGEIISENVGVGIFTTSSAQIVVGAFGSNEILYGVSGTFHSFLGTSMSMPVTTINGAPLSIEIDNAAHRGVVIDAPSGQSQALLDTTVGGSRVAAITSTGNVQGTGAYTNLSDAKVKQNVKYLTMDGTALSKIASLKPARFQYVTLPDVTEMGFIAQDLQAIIPEAVVPFDDSNDGRLGIRLDPIVATIILAIKEIQGKLPPGQ